VGGREGGRGPRALVAITMWTNDDDEIARDRAIPSYRDSAPSADSIVSRRCYPLLREGQGDGRGAALQGWSRSRNALNEPPGRSTDLFPGRRLPFAGSRMD